MATSSSNLAWRIPWTEEPGGLQSMGLQRVRNEATESRDFPGSSAGKESTCNTGDPGLISGLGRSPGEVIGSPLQYSWASLEAQRLKHLPPMQETWVRSLGLEDLDRKSVV